MDAKPWFKMPAAGAPNSPAANNLLQALNASIDASKTYKQQWMWDDYRASIMYQRDYMIARYGSTSSALDATQGQGGTRQTDNEDRLRVQNASIVKSSVDTVRNWLFSETPPVGVKASNASFEARSAIDMYSMALDAMLNTDTNADIESIIARDGTLKGFGAGWWLFEGGEIKMKRLHGHQITYDPYDARDGSPQCMYITEWRDKYAMRDWLKGFEGVPSIEAKLDAIMNTATVSASPASPNANTTWTPYDWELATAEVPDSTPRIEVTHCYRLASSPEANDGKYVAYVRGGGRGTVLIDQEFSRTSHPVVWFTPSPNDEGIRGSGLYHDLFLWQQAIDRHMFKIQRTADKYGWPKIFVPKNSIKNLNAFAEAGVFVIEYEGNSNLARPEAIQAIQLLKEDIEWVDKMLTMAMSLNGINAMLSQGSSQLGAGASAVALVEENFRATDRLSSILSRWKRFKLEMARQALYVLDEVLKTNPKFKASFDYKGTSRSMTWADLRKQTGSEVIDVELRGELSGSRAGRVATIVDLASRQLIDNATAQEMMLSTPDVRRAARLSLAGTRYVEWQLDKLIRNDEIETASPTEDMDDQTLMTAVDRATKYIFLARIEGAKDETIERLRSYKLAAEILIKGRVTDAPPIEGAVDIPQ